MVASLRPEVGLIKAFHTVGQHQEPAESGICQINQETRNSSSSWKFYVIIAKNEDCFLI